MKKNLIILSFIVAGLLTGCLTTGTSFKEKASSVPHLTEVMHVLAGRGNYFSPTNLPPSEVGVLFAKAIVEDPSLETFRDDQILIQLRNGQVDILICDPRTGIALYEDISCTPRLDIRWYESKEETKTFTVVHPESCGCKK